MSEYNSDQMVNRTLRQMLVKPKDPIPIDQPNGVVSLQRLWENIIM